MRAIFFVWMLVKGMGKGREGKYVFRCLTLVATIQTALKEKQVSQTAAGQSKRKGNEVVSANFH